MMALHAISLFAGAGGLDYGFEAAGFSTVVALEFDRECCNTLRTNRPDWQVMEADVHSVASSAILSSARLNAGEADVLIGGPPCQPFSKSGYWASGDSKRLADPRASTLAAYLRVLGDTRPRTFLLENVEGLGFSGKDEGLRLVMAGLDKINRKHGTSYSASVRVLNAADFGVPQIRRRLFIVGSRDGTKFTFPEPSHADPKNSVVHEEHRPYYATGWDALHDIARLSNDDLRLKGKWADLLPSIPEGENYLWHTSRGGGLALFGWRRRFWNFLLKAAKDRPVWTIQAQPGPATGPFHWENRRFSAEELKRLQTFPRGIEVRGSSISVQKQIGNAVPSLLAEVIAREIRRKLLARRGPSMSKCPTLAVKGAPMAPPPPVAVAQVPNKYLELIGNHSPHPGTGKGPGASARFAAPAMC